MNGEFSTEDIQLASYLCAKGIILQEIRPLDKWRSLFIFEEKPSRDLLNYWLTEASYERSLINAYRHLVRDSKKIQVQKFGGR